MGVGDEESGTSSVPAVSVSIGMGPPGVTVIVPVGEFSCWDGVEDSCCLDVSAALPSAGVSGVGLGGNIPRIDGWRDVLRLERDRETLRYRIPKYMIDAQCALASLSGFRISFEDLLYLGWIFIWVLESLSTINFSSLRLGQGKGRVS